MTFILTLKLNWMIGRGLKLLARAWFPKFQKKKREKKNCGYCARYSLTGKLRIQLHINSIQVVMRSSYWRCAKGKTMLKVKLRSISTLFQISLSPAPIC